MPDDGCGISENAELLGFSCTRVSKLYKDGIKDKKKPLLVSSVNKYILLVRENRPVQVHNCPNTYFYNNGVQQVPSEHTTDLKLKRTSFNTGSHPECHSCQKYEPSVGMGSSKLHNRRPGNVA